MAAYLGTLVMAAAAGWVLFEAAAWIGRGEPPPRVRDLMERLRPQHSEPPIPPVLLEMELHRLDTELSRVRGGDPQGLALRIRATQIAYDDALAACCQAHGLPTPPELRPMTTSQRLNAEAELLSAGVTW
ncbi:MAG: hypothetical protein ACK5MT_12790 [Actinomycetales bacterium]